MVFRIKLFSDETPTKGKRSLTTLMNEAVDAFPREHRELLSYRRKVQTYLKEQKRVTRGKVKALCKINSSRAKLWYACSLGLYSC